MPGFRNPLVLGPVTFTPDAYPFRMHLNLDRSAVGFALLLLYRPLCREAGVARCGSALPARVQGLSCFFPLALRLPAIRWAPKLPEGVALWALDNFLSVAFAEEALFRGFLQSSLARWLGGFAGEA